TQATLLPYPTLFRSHQPGGFMPPPHQTAPLPPMYQHAHVNAHTTTHAPFNDKHPCTRSSNNQDAPTAQHQPHRDATTNTPPQPRSEEHTSELQSRCD